MADFPTWDHASLAKLAADQQAEIVRINNENAKLTRLLAALMNEYADTCGMFCKIPVRSTVYRECQEVFKQ